MLKGHKMFNFLVAFFLKISETLKAHISGTETDDYNATRFNATQRKYLTEQFIKGETSGRKANPEYVAKDMKTYTEDGHKVFKADEYLKRSQIASFFSRMAASRRKATSANEVDQVEAEADDLSTFEEYEDDDIMDQAMEHLDFLDNLETVMLISIMRLRR